ncbi:winged helix-turn-helix domain-containing protein, partial [bacterium]|nr:winged helix-turn-helix domain-containing protein [bacterium]
TIDELVSLYRQEDNAKACVRLLCAVHRKKGKTITEIANVLELPVSTVSDHLRRLSHNFEDVYDMCNQQRPPKLTQKEHSQLIESIKKPPVESGYPAIVWTTKMVLHYIQTNFDKTFTPHGVRKLLHRANFALLKPRPYHAKGDKKEQAAFKKNYRKSLINICKMDMRSSFWMNQDSS